MTDRNQRVIDAAFRHHGVAIDYIPDGGQQVTVPAVIRNPDGIDEVFGQQARRETLLLDIRVSDIAAPAPPDVLILGGTGYVVQGAPLRDRSRLVWKIEAVKE